jgi:hypothetical protein
MVLNRQDAAKLPAWQRVFDAIDEALRLSAKTPFTGYIRIDAEASKAEKLFTSRQAEAPVKL